MDRERLAIAVAGATAGLAVGLCWQRWFGAQQRQQQLKNVVLAEDEDPGPFSQPLLDEQLSRNTAFFGEDGQKSIQDSFVIVVGLGGVGSHCAHMLARSGIKRMRIIDFDQVTLSSLNRHAVANRSDVGTPKALALRKHLLRIVPHCNIDAQNCMFEGSAAEKLLEGDPDYVVDCIDDVNTKVELLHHCQKRGIRVISCMGAGAKADPTRLCIGEISDAVRDPLASKVRWKLKQVQGKKGKKQEVDDSGIVAVYSSEKPVINLMPLTAEQKEQPSEFGTVEHFRIRTIPVLGTMPALMGQAQAAYVLSELGGKIFQPEATARLSRDLRHKLYQRLQNRERNKFSNTALDIDKDEIDFIVQYVWKSRSAVSGVRMGGAMRVELTRWDASRPCAPDNLVLVSSQEAEKLNEQGQAAFSQGVIDGINQRFREIGPF